MPRPGLRNFFLFFYQRADFFVNCFRGKTANKTTTRWEWSKSGKSDKVFEKMIGC